MTRSRRKKPLRRDRKKPGPTPGANQLFTLSPLWRDAIEGDEDAALALALPKEPPTKERDKG